MNVLEKLIQIIRETYPENVFITDDLNTDLDLDLKQIFSSIELVEIFICLEEEYDITFEDINFEQKLTICSLVKETERQLEAK